MSVVGILGLIPSSRDGWMIASIIIATDGVTVVMIAGRAGYPRGWITIRRSSIHSLQSTPWAGQNQSERLDGRKRQSDELY